MYCKKCGKLINDNSSFCEHCNEMTTNEYESDNFSSEEDVIVKDKITSDALQISDDNTNFKPLPMNWYNFLVKWSLPVTVIYGCFMLIRNVIETLNSLDMSLITIKLYIFLSITYNVIKYIICVLAIFKLRSFKKLGLIFLFIFLVLTFTTGIFDFLFFIPTIIYFNLFNSINNTTLIIAAAELAYGAFFFIANYIYFKKRISMFTD